MDAFEIADTPETPRSKLSTGMMWNVLTVLVLVATFCMGGAILSIFINPQSSFNPFPPPVQPTAAISPTATATPRLVLPPTWTPSPTVEPTATYTPGPTNTPLVQETSFEFSTETPNGPTITPGGMSFVVQQGSPKALPNIYHADLGCDWMGVGGQAVDLRGAPVVGLIVQLGGSLGGVPLDNLLSITGTATQYDRGGFEFTIADHPLETKRSLYLQLLDQAGLPLSEKIYFDTFNDCEKNLIIVYFTQVR